MLRRMSAGSIRFLGIVACATIMAAPVMAQPGAILRGKVVNEKGEPVEGAKVSITSAQSGRVVTLDTDDKGEFYQIGLGSGNHEVFAEKDGVRSEGVQAALRTGATRLVELVVPSPGLLTEAVGAELQALFNQGVDAGNAGRHEEAIAKFREAIAINPNCYDCYSNIGFSYSQLKQYDNAATAYEKAVEIKPDYQAGYTGLATAYTALRKPDLAEKASTKALELASASGGGSADALYSQGVVLFNGGKIAEAKSAFQSALQADPNHAESHYMLGMSLAGEDPAAAVSELETYLKLAPDGPNAANATQFVGALKGALGK